MVLISALSPEFKDEIDLSYGSLMDVLRLRFHDITDDEKYAKMIIDFTIKHLNKIVLMHVHCEAGVSRSAGITLSLAEIFNLEAKYKYHKNWQTVRFTKQLSKPITSITRSKNEILE